MKIDMYMVLSKMARALSKSDVFLEHADLLSKFELLDWKRMIYIVKMSVFIKSVQCEFNKILCEKEEPNHDNVNIYLTKLMFSEWKMFFL